MTVHAAGMRQHYLELLELAAHIKAREISPVAVTLAQLERIASLNATLGSYASSGANGPVPSFTVALES